MKFYIIGIDEQSTNLRIGTLIRNPEIGSGVLYVNESTVQEIKEKTGAESIGYMCLKDTLDFIVHDLALRWRIEHD